MLPSAHSAWRMETGGKRGSIGCRSREARNVGAWKIRFACMLNLKNICTLVSCSENRDRSVLDRHTVIDLVQLTCVVL